jgi:hypothetical protein
VRVVLIPTKVLVLDWSKTPEEKRGNFDSKLSRITVNIQGWKIHMELSQTLRIPEQTAPKLVSEFGDAAGSSPVGGLIDDISPVQRFVEKVLGATVEGYINEIAAGSSVQEFFGKFDNARLELTDKVGAALRAYDVEPGQTILGNFEPDDPRLNEAIGKAALEEARNVTRGHQVEGARKEAEITAILTDKNLMEAAPDLWAQVMLIGKADVARQRIFAELAKLKTPHYIGGGADLGSLLPLHSLLGELVRDAVQGNQSAPQALDEGQDPDPEITDGE